MTHVQVLFTPSEGARVEVIGWPGSEHQALRLVFSNDHVVVIGPPASEDGAAVLAQFLVELSGTSVQLAAALDSSKGRHALSKPRLSSFLTDSPTRWPTTDHTDHLGEPGAARLPE
nr:hypothetical protein GCM10017745_16260 [Saccharothrix mutabilis subsp. capreolus]